ncbi:MAG: hypothetical protein H6743_03710 [Rickettsiaceae bacterium]|nr:hypothetical protein [Rickettsiaceae bacterium]
MPAPHSKNLDKKALFIWSEADKDFVAWDGMVDVDLPGFDIPDHDYIALTYVTSGNGIGEIETAVYKTGGASGTIVATLTLAYNVDNKLVSVTKT